MSLTDIPRGEAVALTRADVDLGSRRIIVRRRLYRGRFDAAEVTVRVVGDTDRRGARACPLATPGKAPVFPSRDGTHLDPSNVAARVLKPAARRAGVPWAGFHTFRHTCATILFRHGLEWKASADVARPPLARVHVGDLRSPPRRRSARPRFPRPDHRTPNRRCEQIRIAARRCQRGGRVARTARDPRPSIGGRSQQFDGCAPSPGKCGDDERSRCRVDRGSASGRRGRIVPLRLLELGASYLVGTARSERGLVAGRAGAARRSAVRRRCWPSGTAILYPNLRPRRP